MAVMQQNDEKSMLSVSPQSYYFNTMRPYLGEVYMKCRTDEELCRTVDKVINASDSACAGNDLGQLDDAYDILEKVIRDPHYFEGPMRKGTEDEKEMVRGLMAKIDDLRLIIKSEKVEPSENPAERERYGYHKADESSPIGENEDFGTRNMKTLNEPHPKPRIPNIN